MIIASFPKGSFPEYSWPVGTWPIAPEGADIQYTEVMEFAVCIAASAGFSVVLPNDASEDELSDSILVSGAGVSLVNGTYLLNGTFTTKSRWSKITPAAPRGYCYIVWSVKYSNWLIGYGGKTGDPDAVTLIVLTQYRSSDNVATPDLCTTWVVNPTIGVEPIPTVITAPITPTLTEIAAFTLEMPQIIELEVYEELSA